MNYRVSEIYRAIQGEGWHAGLPCTIVRLQGCNLRCEFCDTPYAQDPKGGAAMSLNEIYAEIDRVGHRKGDIILVTGGEPALQDLTTLAARLAGLGPIHIETNGTPATEFQLQAVSPRAAWITVSPKPPNSIARGVLRVANEIKWLIAGQSDVHTLRQFLASTAYLMGSYLNVSVQPISLDQDATTIAYDACLKYGWRLSLQLHKILERR